VVGSLAALSALSYPLAIVLPAPAGEAVVLVRLSLLLGLLTALAAAAVLALWGPALLLALNAGEIAPWAMLIPVAMLVGVCSQVMSHWLARHQAFAFGARFAVLASLLANGLKAIFGWLQPVAAALILAGLAGTLAGTALAWLRWRHRAGAAPEPAPATSPWAGRAWTLAQRYRDFPLLRTPQDSLNALSQAAPLMVLAAAYGAGAAGQYTLAAMALGAPVGLLGQSVGTVFYPRVTALVQARANVAAEIWRTTRGLAMVAAGPFLLLAVAGPALFALLFGEAWRTAGEYARWLSPWLFLQLVNKPAVAAIPALRLQGGLLVYEVASTGSKLLALWAGWKLALGDVGSVALFSLAGSLAYLWLISWVLMRARRHSAHEGSASE
jgi:O-antigen/teichoic acid export membrane protein